MISVVVVNRNGGATLGRCLAGLAGRDLELVLVDNASSDGSVELARQVVPGLRLLPQGSNLGFGAAVNLGVAASSGDPILLLNPDAWPLDDALERLERALAADSRLGMVAPRLLFPDGRPQFVWAPDRSLVGEAVQKARNRFEHRRWSHRPLELLLRALFGPGWLSAACAAVRRAAFERVGGFDPGYFLYFEDVDLGLRLRRAGYRLAVVEDARACHLGGGRPVSDEVLLHRCRSQLRYYRLHRPAWEARVLLWHLRRVHRTGAVAEWLRAADAG